MLARGTRTCSEAESPWRYGSTRLLSLNIPQAPLPADGPSSNLSGHAPRHGQGPRRAVHRPRGHAPCFRLRPASVLAILTLVSLCARVYRSGPGDQSRDCRVSGV